MSKNKKIKLNLKEMFVLYLASDKVEFISHKLALKKQVDVFVSTPEFCRLIELRDIVVKNNTDVLKKNGEEINAFRKDLKPWEGKSFDGAPEEIKEKFTQYNQKMIEVAKEQNEANKDYLLEFDNLSKDETEYNLDCIASVKNALDGLLNSEGVKIEDLKKKGFGDEALECLMDLYCRYDK